MKKSEITYILGSVFASGTAFFYCCTRWFSIKLPRYYPLEHTWKLVNEKGVPSQKWYSMQVFAYLAAAIVTLLVYIIIRTTGLKDVNLKPAFDRLLGIIVTMIVIVCMSYILYYEFNKWGIF